MVDKGKKARQKTKAVAEGSSRRHYRAAIAS